MRLVLILASVLLLPRAQSLADDKPNIIYILLDDAGYGDLSCYGQQKFETPNVDRLAKEGMKFTQHYAGSTVCAPTRCCLMTGLHTGHTFVRGNREVKPEGQAAMPPDIVTIPRLLKRAGYVTGAFGKWGLGAPGSASDPTEHFDFFFGYNCQREAHRYYPDHLWRNQKRIELDGNTWTGRMIMDESLQFVRAHHEQPFFLFLPITIPHAAMQAPDKDTAAWRKQFSQFEDTIGRYAGTETQNPIATFAAMMTVMDEGIGQHLELLNELGIDDNTIVFFTSDNGPHREGGHNPEFFNSNGPYRGFKRDLYEGGIRVPFMAKWPGKLKAGREYHKPVVSLDVFGTAAAIAEAPIPKNRPIDGVNLLPFLTASSDESPHEKLFWRVGTKAAIRSGDWKLLRNPGRRQKDAKWELYNLKDDISETTNLAAEDPDRLNQLAAAWEKLNSQMIDPVWQR